MNGLEIEIGNGDPPAKLGCKMLQPHHYVPKKADYCLLKVSKRVRHLCRKVVPPWSDRCTLRWSIGKGNVCPLEVASSNPSGLRIYLLDYGADLPTEAQKTTAGENPVTRDRPVSWRFKRAKKTVRTSSDEISREALNRELSSMLRREPLPKRPKPHMQNLRCHCYRCIFVEYVEVGSVRQPAQTDDEKRANSNRFLGLWYEWRERCWEVIHGLRSGAATIIIVLLCGVTIIILIVRRPLTALFRPRNPNSKQHVRVSRVSRVSCNIPIIHGDIY